MKKLTKSLRKRATVCVLVLALALTWFVALSPKALYAATSKPNTATAPRPKSISDGKFEVPGVGGNGPIALHIYIQEGKSFSDPDAYVFYEPFVRLETDSNGKIVHKFDEINKTLTLRIRFHYFDMEMIEKFREQLTKVARKKNQEFKLEKGMKPFVIQPLKPERAWFEFSKFKGEKRNLVSKPLDVNYLETGGIPVHFAFDNIKIARQLFEELQEGFESIIFKYQFAAVADEMCTATINSGRVQELDVYRRVVGSGSEGTVTRNQALQLADKIVATQAIESRCSDLGGAEDLIAMLLDILGIPTKEKTVNSWDDVEKMVTFDINDFKADVTEKTKDIKNEVVRNQLLDAMSKAESSANSSAIAGGAKVGWGPFKGEVSGSYAEAEAETQAEAKKIYKDALKKQGIYGEFKGNKYKPKSVNVHTKADVETAWLSSNKLKLSVTKGATGRGSFYITRPNWITVRPYQEWQEVFREWKKEMTAQLETESRQRKSEIQSAIKNIEVTEPIKIAAIGPENNGKLTLRAKKYMSIKSRGRLALQSKKKFSLTSNKRVSINARDSIALKSNDSVSIKSRNGVNISAKTMKINGEPLINVVTCYYRLEKNKSNSGLRYEFGTGRNSKAALIADWETFPTDEKIQVSLARRGGKKGSYSNWHINLTNWRRRVDWVGVRVLFLDGFGVGRDTTSDPDHYKSSARLKLDRRANGKKVFWCSN